MTAATALGRIAVRGASNNRVLRAGHSAVQTTFHSIRRVVHILWLQMVGVLFCLFAVVFAARLPSVYQDHVAGKHGPGRVYLLVAMALMFAWFGVSSFWRARKR